MTTKATPGRKPLYPEMGVSGLKQYSGFVREEFLTDLRGQRGMNVYREIRDNSAKVGAALGAATMTALKVNWWVESSAEPDGQMRADFVDSCRSDMSSSWRDCLREQFTMLPYGFAPIEIVYKRRQGPGMSDPRGRSKFSDGLIGWRKLPLRAQETIFKWDFDDAGGIQGLWQLAAPKFKLTRIPIEKLLLFRTTVERNNPEGRSVLRNAYKSYYQAKRCEEALLIGLERDLNGIPVFKVPPEVLKGETAEMRAVRDECYAIVKNLRQDEQAGVVYQSSYDEGGRPLFDLSLMTNAGRKQFDHVAILNFFEGNIVASMLYDLLMGGQPNSIQYRGQGGTDFFADSIAGWLDVITDVFNAHAIPRLYRVNGWSTEACAKLRHGEIRPPDIAKLADFISKIAPAGFLTPGSVTEEHLRRVAGFPDETDPRPLVAEPEGDPEDPAPDDIDAEPEPEATALREKVRKLEEQVAALQASAPAEDGHEEILVLT